MAISKQPDGTWKLDMRVADSMVAFSCYKKKGTLRCLYGIIYHLRCDFPVLVIFFE
ncbi:hypothetical protein Sbal117_1363 [Shewanella baltica OS117]|nr:hypothetical protein Sbal117_1363 [Shewanella baltica OS117]